MDNSRRQFLKLTTIGGVTGSVLGFDLAPAYAQVRELKIARTTETRSTCPYWSVSCGVIIHTLGDRSGNVKPTVVHVEGDPDHPINQGALCPKGITLKQNIVNDRRLTKVMYRAPGGRAWEERSWDWAIDRIARLMKASRDARLVEQDDRGQTLNALTAVGVIGGCTDTNEVNYLRVKAFRAGLGVTPIEQQSRICHGPTVASLAATFGRGAMTNGWTDVRNADVVLAMGGNPAENHPVGFRFVMEAKRNRNAKLICIDPRFNRTAAVADAVVQVRVGTDIAFVGGPIHHALSRNRLHADFEPA